jgi:hypothetical protein
VDVVSEKMVADLVAEFEKMKLMKNGCLSAVGAASRG